MDNIKYYIDIKNDFLLAYDSTTEFFVIYAEKTGEWKDCSISFSNFRHDYEYKEISKEEAYKKANGALPEAKLQEYLRILGK